MEKQKIWNAVEEDLNIWDAYQDKEVVYQADFSPNAFGGVLKRHGRDFAYFEQCKRYTHSLEEIEKSESGLLENQDMLSPNFQKISSRTVPKAKITQIVLLELLLDEPEILEEID